jgi:putative transcriptional regulator
MDGLAEIEAGLGAGGGPVEARFTVRTVELPDEPGAYDAAAVRATRAKLGASQAVFARLLGVSLKLAQAWERGARQPSPLARRLLDEFNANPRRWIALIGRPPRRAAEA